MNFREHLTDYEGLLDWSGHFRLRSGAVIGCRNYEDYKTGLTINDDYIIVEHLKKMEDGVLYPLRADYIPLGSIDCFQIELNEED